jgi:3-oxoadipate enol-lactonase
LVVLVRLSDGTRFAYEARGEGSPVVLVHGLTGTRELWKHQVPVLAKQFRVITLDVRGHGESDKPPGPYSVPRFAEDVVELLDQLEVFEATLVGLSMGGGIVQTLALDYPSRARALALVSTSSDFTPPVRQRFHEWADIAEREGMAPLAPQFIASWLTPEFRARCPQEFESNVQSVLANEPRAFAASARANSERNWTDQLHRITCPTLFVGGAADAADPLRAASIYRERVRDLEVHLLPDVSHLLPLEAPERFNEILLRFLERVARPARGATAS